jgi:hypothetical protein
MPSLSQLCGWVPRPDEVNRILGMKANPTFQEAAPHLKNLWQQEEVGLWRAAKIVNGGQHLPADKQTIGDCVSHGHGRGMDYLYCCKQSVGLASGYIEGQTSAMTEYVYGISREAGNSLGPQDGSNGIWAIDGMKVNGYISREGKQYDGQLAKQYGWRGVPADLKGKGKIHLLEDYALIQTPDDCANALKAGSPVPICSDQGFAMARDANGICRATGTWNHCMLVIGVFQVSGKWYFVILQSWGQNTPTGPVPQNLDFPDNAFGCDWDTMGRILKQRDSYALSGVKGWEPLPPLNWVM